VHYLGGELTANHPWPAESAWCATRERTLAEHWHPPLAPEAILISPGPAIRTGRPSCLEVLKELGPTLPILACASAINAWAPVFGGRVPRAAEY